MQMQIGDQGMARAEEVFRPTGQASYCFFFSATPGEEAVCAGAWLGKV